MTSSPPAFSAAAIAQAIKDGKLTCREAVEQAIARLNAKNPQIYAVTTVLTEEALAAADAADKEGGNGPLRGVPITIKENTDQIGSPTTNGVVAFSSAIAREDSPVVANLRRAGAIIVGRTNTPAFNLRSHTDNALYGPTLNPWSVRHTPGGSSGGAAASVAAGITPLAHANDFGGSIRYPAHCCGVYGLKPGFGRVPQFNATAPAERPSTLQLFLVQGALARSVGDLRLAFHAMSRGDYRDPFYVPAPLTWPPAQEPLRVAVPRAYTPTPLSAPVAQAMDRAASILSDSGYRVEVCDVPSFQEASELWSILAGTEIRMLMLPTIQTLADDDARRVIERNLSRIPKLDLAAYMRAWAEHVSLKRKWLHFLEDYPLILAPVSTHPPELVGFDLDSDDSRAANYLVSTRFTRSLNLLGLPSVTLPCGMSGAVPIALQIVGRPFREDSCLAAAETIESQSGFSMLT